MILDVHMPEMPEDADDMLEAYAPQTLAPATQVLVVASQKGGSGKTTLAGHLAVQAEQAGAGPVALIDTDPQGSLAKWWNAREKETPAFAEVSVPDLERDIERLRASGFKLIVIDTPPALTSSIAEVIMHADLVIIPTRPSPHDLRAIGPTVDMIEYQRKPLVFVINAATARARITGETAVVLSQHGTVAPVTVHHRVDFAASMIDGRTVGEVNEKSRSAREISNLWAYLDDRLFRMRTSPTDRMGQQRASFEDDFLTPAPATHKQSVLDNTPAEDAMDVSLQETPVEETSTDQTSGNDMRGETIEDFPTNEPLPPSLAEFEISDVPDDLHPLSFEPTPAPVSVPDIPYSATHSSEPANEPMDIVPDIITSLPVASPLALPIQRHDLSEIYPPHEDMAANDPLESAWDGIDRREEDQGPPAHVPERRASRQVFGRRGEATRTNSISINE